MHVIRRENDEVRVSEVFNNFEVYSGSGEDDTPEELKASSQDDRWSLVARTSDELANQPMAGRYFVFSVEELSTIEGP